MFKKTYQNYSFIDPYKSIDGRAIESCMNRIFLDRIKKPDLFKQVAAIEELKKFQDEKVSRGYGEIGIKDLVHCIITGNPISIEISLQKLENEMKNSYLAQTAFKHGVTNQISFLIKRNANVNCENLKIILLSLKILNLIAKDFKECQVIVTDVELLKTIFIFLNNQPELSDACADVLETISLSPYTSRSLLTSNYFIDEFLISIQNTSSEKLFAILSNFMSSNPEIFAKIEIFKSLISNISKSKVLKCLADMILYCDDCRNHGFDMKIENTLYDILNETCDEDIETYAIVAMRNYMTFRSIATDEFPWQQLLMILMQTAYTKINEMLQVSCIQAIRTMSDATVVKDYLRKNYAMKLRKIPCISERSRGLKRDLIDWLKYKNYKYNDDSNKYSKVFT